MGKYLNRAKLHFGTDTRGLLEGGRYALVHTRTLELDELRPYVAGDDVRDIEWRASARSGTVLIKKFVPESHHKVLLVADAGRNMAALAPSGEVKRDLAVLVMGAIGLITMRRSDQIGMVYGDARGSTNIRHRGGETHIESLIDSFYSQTVARPYRSDIVSQLEYVARSYRQRMVVIIVSDEPDVDERLATALQQLSGRHDLLWAMIADMPAVGSPEGERDGYDVGTGDFVFGGATLGPRVIAAYRRAEAARMEQLEEFLTTRGIFHTRIGGSAEVRSKLVETTRSFRHAW